MNTIVTMDIITECSEAQIHVLDKPRFLLQEDSPDLDSLPSSSVYRHHSHSIVRFIPTRIHNAELSISSSEQHFIIFFGFKGCDNPIIFILYVHYSISHLLRFYKYAKSISLTKCQKQKPTEDNCLIAKSRGISFPKSNDVNRTGKYVCHFTNVKNISIKIQGTMLWSTNVLNLYSEESLSRLKGGSVPSFISILSIFVSISGATTHWINDLISYRSIEATAVIIAHIQLIKLELISSALKFDDLRLY